MSIFFDEIVLSFGKFVVIIRYLCKLSKVTQSPPVLDTLGDEHRQGATGHFMMTDSCMFDCHFVFPYATENSKLFENIKNQTIFRVCNTLQVIR